jgi:Flp pilus assembly protein TadG
MRRFLQRLAGDERGGALAEFALGLIPLILAFALIFEVGRAFWIHQAAIKGVRDATRYLTRVEDPTNATAQDVARRLMLTGQQAPGGVARWDSGAAAPMVVAIQTVDNSDGALRGPATIRMVTVGTNVEILLPLAGVFTLFGGAPAAFTFSLSDTGRHYGV